MYTGEVYFDKASGEMVDYLRGDLRRALDNAHWSPTLLSAYHQKLLSGIVGRDNYIFKDRLIVAGMQANRLIVQSLHTNKKYSVFISNVPQMINKSVNGIIEGLFTFRRNGSAFGIIPVPFEFEDNTLPAEVSAEPTMDTSIEGSIEGTGYYSDGVYHIPNATMTVNGISVSNRDIKLFTKGQNE